MKDLSTEVLKQKRALCIKRLRKGDFKILRGSLIERYKRCGKVGCKCADGPGHGPKFYLSVSFPGRRPEIVYIPSDLKEKVEAALTNLNSRRQELEEIAMLNLELIKRKVPFE